MFKKALLPLSIFFFGFSLVFAGACFAFSELIREFKNTIYPAAKTEKKILSVTTRKINEVAITPTITFAPTKPEPTSTPTIFPTAFPTLIPTIQKADNSAKLNAISELFKKIGSLNANISSYLYMKQTSLSSYQCDESKYSNPESESYVWNPFERDKIYQQCLMGQQGVANDYDRSINSLKNEISTINRQIEGIVDSCEGNECFEFYWSTVKSFESNGWIVR